MIYTRPATLQDAEWVGANLRQADRHEVLSVHPRRTPEESTVRAFRMSRESFAFHDTARVQPLAIFGSLPDEQHPEFGIIWLLGTEAIKGHPVSILRESVRWLDFLAHIYPRGLHNFADTRNDLHIRWCQLAGFTLGDTVAINGTHFQYIHRGPAACAIL